VTEEPVLPRSLLKNLSRFFGRGNFRKPKLRQGKLKLLAGQILTVNPFLNPA
jgi:hypothetical protein